MAIFTVYSLHPNTSEVYKMNTFSLNSVSEKTIDGATAEYPGEIEAGERASHLRVKFLWGLDLRTRQFAMCWLRVEPGS